jgi:HlyD family secretion protein
MARSRRPQGRRLEELMFKIVGIILATALVAGGSVAAWDHFHTGVDPDPTYAGTSTVTSGPIIQSVLSTGAVASNLDVQIKCLASGEVLQVGPYGRPKIFDVSDTVKKGDLLIDIDPTDENHAVIQAQAQVDISKAKLDEARETYIAGQQQLDQARETAYSNLASAKAQLSDATSKAARRKELLAQELGTQEDYDTAADTQAQMQANLENSNVAIQQLKTQEVMLEIKGKDVDLAKAQLEADQVALAEANTQLSYCKVYAPMDGTITALSIQQGTIISSAASVVGGVAELVLSDMSHIFILADVDESDIGNVDVGQDVDITADAYPHRTFAGKVVRIAAEGVNVANVVTFEVKIEVTSANKDLLKPLMTANVSIIQQKKAKVLLVPVAAVIRKDRNQVVEVQEKGGKTVDHEPVLGITDGTNYEVLSGLSEGDTVVLHKGPGDSRWNSQGRGR